MMAAPGPAIAATKYPPPKPAADTVITGAAAGVPAVGSSERDSPRTTTATTVSIAPKIGNVAARSFPRCRLVVGVAISGGGGSESRPPRRLRRLVLRGSVASAGWPTQDRRRGAEDVWCGREVLAEVVADRVVSSRPTGARWAPQRAREILIGVARSATLRILRPSCCVSCVSSRGLIGSGTRSNSSLLLVLLVVVTNNRAVVVMVD